MNHLVGGLGDDGYSEEDLKHVDVLVKIQYDDDDDDVQSWSTSV